MSYLKDICCICLEKKQLLVSYTQRSDSELSYYEKIFIFIPQMCFSKITIDNQICRDCCKSIDRTISFRNMCLRNKELVLDFIEEFKPCDDDKNNDDLIEYKKSRVNDDGDDVKNDVNNEISECTNGTDKEIDLVALKKVNDLLRRKKRRRLQVRYELKRRRRINKRKIVSEQTESKTNDDPLDTINSVIESVVMAGNSPQSNLQKRREKKYKNRKFECQFCFQIIKHRPKFVEHYNVVHDGRRPFVCELCNKGFIENYQLVNHMRNVHCKF